MNKKYLIVILSFVIFFSIYGKGNGNSIESVDYSIATLNGPTGIGMVHLMEDVVADYTILTNPTMMVPSLLNGEYDIAVVPSNMAALIANRGAPYKAAAVVGNGVIYVVSSNPDIDSFEDLKGETLHVSGKGATPDYLTLHYLSQAGLDPETDITLDYSYSHPDLAMALISGVVDYAVLPEPFVTKTLLANPNLSVAISYQDEWIDNFDTDEPYPISVVIVHDRVSEDSQILSSFMDAYESSIYSATKYPNETGELVEAAPFTFGADEVISSLDRINLVFIPAKDSKEDLILFYELLYSMNPGSIGGSLPGDDFYLEW